MQIEGGISMIWNFDFQSETPLYLQLRNQVVLSVSKGELKPGDKLPTIRALSDESGINMMTISKAYQLLKSEGYVHTDRRSGTVIAEGSPSATVPPDILNRLRLVLAELRLEGLNDQGILELCRTYLKEDM